MSQSPNGTIYNQIGENIWELEFSDGSTTTVNTFILGLSIEEIVETYEKQRGLFKNLMDLTPEEFTQLIEDFESFSGNTENENDADAAFALQITNTPAQLPTLPQFMKLSELGFRNIVSLIPFVPEPIVNSNGNTVIGYGTVVDENDFIDGLINRADGMQLLQSVIGTAIAAVQGLINVPLSQNQFDSLVGAANAMGPTAFANSGIPEAVNSGQMQKASEIRNCYNGVNGEYSDVKGFEAKQNAAGMSGGKNPDGTIADPDRAENPGENSDGTSLTQQKQELMDSINSYAGDSTKLSEQEMKEVLAGFAERESGFNTNLSNPTSSARGPYQYLKNTWLEDVEKYGSDIPGLEKYSEKITEAGGWRKTPAGLKAQILKTRYNENIATQMMVKRIDNYYVPLVQRRGVPVNIYSLYSAHYLPNSVSRNSMNYYMRNPAGLNRGKRIVRMYQ